MPRKCYIPGCLSNSGKFSHYTPVFSFPKNETRRERWIEAVKAEFKFITEEDPGVNACICVHHFEPELVERQPQLKAPTAGNKYPPNKLRLLKDAVPTIFKPNLECPKKKRTRKIRKLKRKTEKANAECDTAATSKPKNLPSRELIEKIREEQIKINIYSTYLQDYGPQYYISEWDRNFRVLKESIDKTQTNPLNWTVERVSEQITKTCQNADIGELFRDQEIDGSVLLDLSKEDLRNLLGLKLGPCIKISTLIEKLRDQVLYKHVISEELE